MLLDFIEDRTTRHLDQQYMLGPNLLFAPVFGDEGHQTEFYIPSGAWTAITPLIGTGKPRVIAGPRWVKEAVPLDEIPAFVRPGSVLVLAPPGMKKPEFEMSGLEVRIYEFSPGATTTCDVPSGRGTEISATLQVSQEDGEVTVKVVQGGLENWSIRLFKEGLTKLDEVHGAAVQGEGECLVHGGFLLKVEAGVNEIKIKV